MAFEVKTNITQGKTGEYIPKKAWPIITPPNRLDRLPCRIPDEILITDLRKQVTYRQINLIKKRTSGSSWEFLDPIRHQMGSTWVDITTDDTEMALIKSLGCLFT